MAKPTCLFIGRFQPYHNGHHLVIQGMTKLCGKIIIGIGSSDKSRSPENPYTAQERKEMIQSALQDEDLIPMFDINFINVPDLENNEAWTRQVMELAGPVDMVWTGNEQTMKCFEGKLPIKEIKEVPGISASAVRALVKSGGDWASKVPDGVARAIREMGLDRLGSKTFSR
ncbi:adenylyltransferase/cytidyltransferase family protein [Candidatus Uhrbacteria bacterium]|nr:adenylyltransferase/cytidyltransferase family protein [Candidatus Uhrbacteria bacterium]